MAGRFRKADWDKINDLLTSDGARFGLPEGGREASLVLSSFNIRKLGKSKLREREIDFMARFCARCDLVAIQEVQDSLEGLDYLKQRVEALVAGQGEYRILVSDVTGKHPGESGMAERLAFLYRKHRIRRMDLASDITIDRTGVMERIIKNEKALVSELAEHAAKMAKHLAAMEKYEKAKADGKKPRKPSAPKFDPLDFYTFARTPHVAAFEAPAYDNGDPLQFLAVNAHLLFGKRVQRKAEFRELVTWIYSRLKQGNRMVAPNAILLGDLNMDFDDPTTDSAEINDFMKTLNRTVFKSSKTDRVYLPFIDRHPATGEYLRSNARQKETYDQIIFFRSGREERMPHVGWKTRVPAGPPVNPDGYNFGVFNFVELFAEALHGKTYDELSQDDEETKDFLDRFQHSVSDHMPIWVRLPRPGFPQPSA